MQLSQQPAPNPRRAGWMWAGALAGLVLAVGMFRATNAARTDDAVPVFPLSSDGVPMFPSGGGTFVVSGAVVLGGSFEKDGSGGCAGIGAHADVVDGAAVVITTMGGLATGSLAVPQALDDGTCRFSFSVGEVPTGQDAYGIKVADQDVRRFTEQDLSATLVSIRLD